MAAIRSCPAQNDPLVAATARIVLLRRMPQPMMTLCQTTRKPPKHWLTIIMAMPHRMTGQTRRNPADHAAAVAAAVVDGQPLSMQAMPRLRIHLRTTTQLTAA